MASKNRIEIIGNLGKDAQVTAVGEKYVIKFPVAVTEKWKDRDGQEKEDTQWFDCEWWVRNQTISQYLTKGRQVLVEGKMRSHMYDAKDGIRRESWELRVTDILFFGKSSDKTGEAEPEKHTAGQEQILANPALQELADRMGLQPEQTDLPF